MYQHGGQGSRLGLLALKVNKPKKVCIYSYNKYHLFSLFYLQLGSELETLTREKNQIRGV